MSKSESQENEAFFKLADQFVELANESLDEMHPDLVNSAFLYAAARFNAFVLASQSECLEDLQLDKDDSSRYFIGQYKRMLLENLEDYEASYKELWPSKKKPK